MRIALYDNLHFSGGKRQEFEMARMLTMHGHTVDLWTTTDADSAFLDWTTVTAQQHVYPWPQSFSTPRRLPGLRGYLVAAATIERIRRVRVLDRAMATAIDRERYDLVLVHHCPLVHAPFLLQFLRTPSVYFCGEPAREFSDPPIPRPYHAPQSRSEALHRRWYAPAYAAVAQVKQRAAHENIQHASLVMTNSHFTAESIYRAYGRHARVCYLAVDTDLFRPRHGSRGEYVLSVGEIKPHKGFDFLIEALGCLPTSVRPPLLLVGNTIEPREERFLHELAARHGVRLDIRGMVSDGELAQLYAEARVFLYAPVLEPFGLAAIEAMACGTPVIGVAEGGVRESIRHEETGLLTERDPRAFACVLTHLFTNEQLRTRLSTEGLAVVRSFWNWDAVYERFMRVIEESMELPVFQASQLRHISHAR